MTQASKFAIAVAAVAALTSPVFAGEPQPACSGPTCSGPCAVTADSAAQARMGELVTRQRDELINLTRTLTAERKRQTELEAELAQARAANQTRQAPPVIVQAAAADDVAEVQDENRRLRAQLASERAENDRLEAKLRTAQKVANLVFREDAPAAAAVQPQGDSEPLARAARSGLPLDWHAPEESSAQKSTVWTREIDDYKAPAEPSAQKSTVWTREAMGY